MAIDDGAAVKLGARSSIGAGEETVYGTAVASTRFFKFNSEQITRGEQRLESEAIAASEFQTDWGLGAQSPGGDVVTELAGVRQALLWKHAFGAIDTVEETPANGVWLHTITPDVDAMMDLSLTLQVLRDDVRFRYTGGQIGQVQLSAEVDRIAQVTWSLVCREELLGGAPDEPTYPDPWPLFTFVHGSLEYAGAEVAVNSVSWQLNNTLADARRRLGSRLRRRAQRNGFRDLTGSFNADFADVDLYNAFVDAVPGDEALLVLEFTSNVEIAAGLPYRVRLRQSVRFDGDTPTVGSPEEIRQQINWKAFPSTAVPTGVEVLVVDDTETP